MLLPESFLFTQQNLQEYNDCHRRFYLREIRNIDWPAIESEPVREQEALILLGSQFHLLCQQFFSGIPVEDLDTQITHPEVKIWWQNFLQLKLSPAQGILLPEKLITIPFLDFRLAAKYDLLYLKPNGTITIYDWKTSKNQPQRKFLFKRLQSVVYPFVAAVFNHSTSIEKRVHADQIDMIYWYTAFPDLQIQFQYSTGQFQTDQEMLEKLMIEIASKGEAEFFLTDDEKSCSYCRYRSLCSRGICAGVLDQKELGDPSSDPFDIDFDTL
ncbi:MAG: PD-(D/E)XK nuclease family protein [Chloroflexi bacterium]|nr:PD-(D/E)XK nuclease family protein [Chloroflexota bacterium]